MRLFSSPAVVTAFLFFAFLMTVNASTAAPLITMTGATQEVAADAAATAAAAPNLGTLDQGQVRVPDSYNNWTPPAAGATFTDAAYGTTIRRLTNGAQLNGEGLRHEYSNISPFNRDNTRLLLAEERNGYLIADLLGKIIIPASELALGPRTEPRWSVTDANVFYFHEGNRLLRYDLRNKQKTVVKTFAQYDIISFGVNEAEVSADGDHLIIGGRSGARQFFGVYRFSTDTLGSTLETTTLGTVVTTDLTPSNQVVLRWGAQGEGRYKGFELFDKNMNFVRQLYAYGARSDLGRDVNGDEVLIVTADNDARPATGCENSGIEKIRLSDGTKTCLLPLFFGTDVNLSINELGATPWLLVTVSDTSGTALPASNLPGDWQSRWKPRNNELLLVKLDGSEKRRLAHHRSRVYQDYWWQPRASLSRDGRYLVFDSNFGTQPRPYYSDVFLIALAGGPTVTTASSVSAASFRNDAVLASETIAALFGTGLAAGVQGATTTPLPTTLNGTTLTVRDSAGVERAAPLFFVAPGQVNYLMPANVARGEATLTVNYGDNQAVGTVKIENVAPGLFAANANGQGVAAGVVLRVRNGVQTYEPLAALDSATRKFNAVPLDLGATGDQVFLVLYGTGIRNRTALSAVTATVGGTNATVAFAGAQGRLLGLDQINLLLPRTLAGRGEVDIVLTVDGKPTNAVRVNVK